MEGKLNPILVNSLLAILASLLCIWYFYASPSSARSAADSVGVALAYVERPSEELRSLIHAANNWYMERKSLYDRNDELETENLRLRTALMEASVPLPQSGGDIVGARVTLRYPDAWWREVRIDKGRGDGIRVGAPVMSDGYLVGRISRVEDAFSWVELITSASFMMAAVVNDTWDIGVVNGDDKGGVRLMFMPTDKEYKRGMIISTALVGDYLPPGIPIGTIWGAGEPRDGYIPQMIACGAHLTQLYGVQVFRSDAEEEEW